MNWLQELEDPSLPMTGLVLDPDLLGRKSCKEALEGAGFQALEASTAEAGVELLDTDDIDALFMDLHLPDADALRVLRRIRNRFPETLVVILASQANVEMAVAAMKLGAYDYVAKPLSTEHLQQILSSVAEHITLRSQNRTAKSRATALIGFGNMVGQSPAMVKLHKIIEKVARSRHPVLILGESGTGKELVARTIHAKSPQSNGPFIPIDCGALAPTLIESELFGHARGAFTGAIGAKQGLLQLAEGGTLFLDEIGELSLDLQAKLLRAIQEKEIRPVGSTRTVPMEVRVLAATNRELETAVRQGSFRKDLFYRLAVVTLRVPPLQQRGSKDILLLINFFLEKLRRSDGQAYEFSPEALKAMLRYEWPGNIRELENAIERAVAFASDEQLEITDLPTQVRVNLAKRRFGKLKGPRHKHSGARIVTLAKLEKEAILNALHELNGDKLKVAKLLGIGKTTLYRKLNFYGFKLR